MVSGTRGDLFSDAVRLMQFSTPDGPLRLGAQDGDFVIDLRAASEASTEGETDSGSQLGLERIPRTMELFLEAGAAAFEAASRALQFARTVRGQAAWTNCAYQLSDIRLHAPLLNPAKIICIGANYKDHVKEANLEAPTEPVFFSKYRNAIAGPTDHVLLPAISQQVDWEAELVVVIGRRGHHIAEADAMSYVAGYTVGNDISARDWQMRKPFRQWMMGKTFDTFLPLGPALVTSDEVPDPHNLQITLRLNDEVMQDESTSSMQFRIPELLSFISRIVTLEPGDIVLTGTPAGVGVTRTPPRFLQEGDVLVTTIENLGTLTNPISHESAAS
jgi:2-keto-4-pentenoate hydratase/2-oxohepta-3-ene-1,7-dioic acid hydratase in catechol pathway